MRWGSARGQSLSFHIRKKESWMSKRYRAKVRYNAAISRVRLLYHGTTYVRWKEIAAANCLQIPDTGTRQVSMTTRRSVAEYFALNSLEGDHHDRRDAHNFGVVLVLNARALRAHRYDLRPFSDPVWGVGKCCWENEIACTTNITPLSEFLCAVELAAINQWLFVRRFPTFRAQISTP
jgi:hypothetical protein